MPSQGSPAPTPASSSTAPPPKGDPTITREFTGATPPTDSSGQAKKSAWAGVELSNGWGKLLAWLRVFRIKEQQEYTVGHMEKEIYSNLTRLDVGLIAIDMHEEPPTSLIRFTAFNTGYFLAVGVDITLIVLILVDTFLCPLTFMWRGSWKNPDMVPGGSPTLIVLLILDVLFALELLLRFNRSYMDPVRKVEVVSRNKIRVHWLGNPAYFLEWFSVISVYLTPFQSDSFPWLQLVKIVRVMNLIDLPSTMWKLDQRSAIRLGRPLVVLIICAHWVACLFSCIGDYREQLDLAGEQSLRTKGPEMHDATSGYIGVYVLSFIEGLYMLTGALDNPVGSGDPFRDQDFGVLVMVAVCGPIGCIMVSLIIAIIMRELSLKTALDAHHEEKLAFMERALANLNISATLQRRVFSQHAFSRMSHDYEAFDALFDLKNVSGPLSCALKVYLYSDSILHKNNTFFSGKNHSYILEVVKVLEDYTFVPGDYVTRRGEVGAEMFFVGRGELSVMVPSKDDPSDVALANTVNTMVKGSHFGEIALVKESLRTAWIMANTYVLLSCLTRDAIEKIWIFFPEERAELQSKVHGILATDKKRADDKKNGTATAPEGDDDGHHCKLAVTILRATHVKNADWSMLGGGKSDPFCSVEVEGDATSRIQTDVVQDSIDPEWNHTGFFARYLKGSALLFKVWDEDDTDKEVLGTATLTSDAFLPEGCTELELPLLDEGSQKGTLTVTVVPQLCGNKAAIQEMQDVKLKDVGKDSTDGEDVKRKDQRMATWPVSKDSKAASPKAPAELKKTLEEKKESEAQKEADVTGDKDQDAEEEPPPEEAKKEATPRVPQAYDDTTAHGVRPQAGHGGDSLQHLTCLIKQVLEGQQKLKKTSEELMKRQLRLEKKVQQRLSLAGLPEPSQAWKPVPVAPPATAPTESKSKAGAKKKLQKSKSRSQEDSPGEKAKSSADSLRNGGANSAV